MHICPQFWVWNLQKNPWKVLEKSLKIWTKKMYEPCNYLYNQCLSPMMLWVRISIRTRCTTLCDKVCQWLATGRWFSAGPQVSFTNKTYRHDITEILLKVALSTIKQTYQCISDKGDDYQHTSTYGLEFCLSNRKKVKHLSSFL